MYFQGLSGLLSFGLLINLLTSCLSANILFYAALSTYSHRIAMWPLAVQLAEKGHSVTFLQPGKNKTPHPKIKDITPNDNEAGIGSIDLLSFRLNFGKTGNVLGLMGQMPSLGANICKSLLEEQAILDWINSSSYDLVLIDALFNDCAYGLAHKWGAKTAIIGTSAGHEWWPDAFGFFMETNWIPNMHYDLPVPLPFYGRVISTLLGLWYRDGVVRKMHPKLEAVLRDKLNMPDMPDIVNLESNISLVLMNSHFSEELARSLPPLVVPVGGMHYEKKTTTPLPKDIQKFIGNEPFIYVSFGSGAQISKAPMELQDKIFDAFRNVKAKFLWKWEAERPANMPPNVYTGKWMPQQSLLEHPQIKAFVTHGGMLSIQESLINAVPMIIFPIFAEQGYNAERVHRKKRGIRLEITDFTQQELETAISNILTDKIYAESTKRDSILFQDRPQKPLDTAVWWVEYVLRHDDLSHLRPLAIHQTWYQKRLLDVWLFVLGVILIVLYLAVLIIKTLFRLCFGSSKTKKLKKN